MNELYIQRPVVAVRAIACDKQGRILLLKRTNTEYGEGKWCLPGGKVGYGDTVEAAFVRELKEETGLDASDVTFLFYQNSLPLQPGKMHCVNLYFSCSCTVEVSLNKESSEFAWVTLQQALDYQPVFEAREAIRRWMGDRTKNENA